jgi:hypothetical protein
METTEQIIDKLEKDVQKRLNFLATANYILLGLMIVDFAIFIVTSINFLSFIGFGLMFVWILWNIMTLYNIRKEKKFIDKFYFYIRMQSRKRAN